jgi:methionyl-tRNA formyltransferase
MRIVFMGSPAMAIPSFEASREIGQLVGVVSQSPKRKGRGLRVEPSPVATAAATAGIDVYTPDSIRTADFLGLLKSLEPDVVIVVAYGKILPADVLNLPSLGCLNVHASLLPELRGAAPIQWAIARGYRLTGVTLMQMDEGMDTGPILLQREVPIGPGDTSRELGRRLALAGGDLLREGLPALKNGELVAREQDHSLATYAPLLSKEDGLIDWSLSATEIANRIRGFAPWPGTYTLRKGNRLGITSGKDLHSLTDREPGSVVKAERGEIEVACGSGTLRVYHLQPEGKREMTAREYMSGYRVAVGERFGE